MSSDKFLDWLCWSWANSGQNFYPVDETAASCVNSVKENYEENHDGLMLKLKLDEAYQWERGQHSRAVMEAEMKLRTVRQWEFAPIERAAREQRDLMEKDDAAQPLDWSWVSNLERLKYIPD